MSFVRLTEKEEGKSFLEHVNGVKAKGGEPGAAIVLCLLAKRNREVSVELSEHDFSQWIIKKGVPTWEKAFEFAKQLDKEKEERDGKE
jgi:hypothetical protein